MDELRTEDYKGHKIFFIRYYPIYVRYWIDEIGEGRTSWSHTKEKAFEHAKRVIDNE